MVLILKCCQGFPDITEYYSNYVDLDWIWVLNDSSNSNLTNIFIFIFCYVFFDLRLKSFFINVINIYKKNVLIT